MKNAQKQSCHPEPRRRTHRAFPRFARSPVRLSPFPACAENYNRSLAASSQAPYRSPRRFAAGLIHSAARPFPTKLSLCGSPVFLSPQGLRPCGGPIISRQVSFIPLRLLSPHCDSRIATKERYGCGVPLAGKAHFVGPLRGPLSPLRAEGSLQR